jgi:hypothetical protein
VELVDGDHVPSTAASWIKGYRYTSFEVRLIEELDGLAPAPFAGLPHFIFPDQ